MIFIGECEKIIVGFGIFKPGDETEFDEALFATGLFKKKDKGGTE